MKLHWLNIIKRSALVIAVLGLAGMLLGCGTVQGVGKDVENIGKGLQQPFDQ
jgi:predicted small secreted protein